MSRYTKAKRWMDESDWRVWVVTGVVAIMSISFVTNLLLDSQSKKARDQFMASFDREVAAFKESRDAAEARDQEVDTAFDQAFERGDQFYDHARKDIKGLRTDMNRIKEKQDA